MDNSTSMAGPLDGLRVLELSDEKAQFCGKLMADLGADVIKVEPPGGQSTRSVGPFLDDIPNRERSLYFWHYNTSKRGVTINLDTNDGRNIFRRMVADTDIVLESYPPGYLASVGLGYEDLAPQNPGLIMCSLTPFGQTGPWKDYQTSDLIHLAAGGQMASCGYDPEDAPDAPPIAPGGGNSWHIGSHYAYMAIMLALHSRYMSGEGQYIDASIHEACALTTESAVAMYIYTGVTVDRHTGRHASAIPSDKTQVPTKDGRWMQTVGLGGNPTTARLRGLAEWMDGYGLAQDLMDDKYLDRETFLNSASHIGEVVADFVANMPQDEVWHIGQKNGFHWGAVRTLDEIVEDSHLRDRQFFTEVEHSELGRSFTYPGPAAIYSASPWQVSRRAPLIGEHNEELFCGELGFSKGELTLLAESGAI